MQTGGRETESECVCERVGGGRVGERAGDLDELHNLTLEGHFLARDADPPLL